MRRTREPSEPPGSDAAAAEAPDAPETGSVEEERDSLWKDAIAARPRTFTECFFPLLAVRVDWDHPIHFLEQELRPRHRRGSRRRRYVDVVASVREKAPAETNGLLHFEVQGQRRPNYERQVHHYRAGLVARHRLPVASAVLQTDTSPTWRVGNFRQQFLGVSLEDPITTTKLRDWDTRRDELEPIRNEWTIIHLAFLFSLPRTGEATVGEGAEPLWAVKARLTAQLAACGLTDDEFQALFRLMDSYLRLPVADEEQFMAELRRQMGDTEMPYLTGIERVALKRGEELGLRRGEELGLHRGQALGEEIGLRRAILTNLETRFGPVPPQVANLVAGIAEPGALTDLIRTSLRVRDLAAFVTEVGVFGRPPGSPASG